MFRARQEEAEVERRYSQTLKTLADAVNTMSTRISEGNELLKQVYEAGPVNPLRENGGAIQWDLIVQGPLTLQPGATRRAVDSRVTLGNAGFLVNALVAVDSNLLGMLVSIQVEGKETTLFQGTVLDLIALGRVNPNARPPSGGLWCSLVGAPLWVVEAEFPGWNRPFNGAVIVDFMNTNPLAAITVTRFTLGYLYFTST